MLISVDLPKTASMSVLKALEGHFGERLLHVHDRPINIPAASAPYVLDPELQARIERWHAKDYRL